MHQSVEYVGHWLTANGLPELVDVFRYHGIDGRALWHMASMLAKDSFQFQTYVAHDLVVMWAREMNVPSQGRGFVGVRLEFAVLLGQSTNFHLPENGIDGAREYTMALTC